MDPIVKTVVDQFISRSEFGLDRNDLLPSQWIQHAIEECMDLLLYMTRLKQKLKEIEEYSETSVGSSSFQ